MLNLISMVCFFLKKGCPIKQNLRMFVGDLKRNKEIRKRCRQLITDHWAWCDSISRTKQPCVHGDLLGILPANSYSDSDCFIDKAKDIDHARLRAKQTLDLLLCQFENNRVSTFKNAQLLFSSN